MATPIAEPITGEEAPKRYKSLTAPFPPDTVRKSTINPRPGIFPMRSDIITPTISEAKSPRAIAPNESMNQRLSRVTIIPPLLLFAAIYTNLRIV